MPKLSLEIKKQIAAISKIELEKIVIKMAEKDKAVFNYLLVNFLEKETGEMEVFEEAKTDLDFLFTKSYKGYVAQLQLANMISACIQRIKVFSKICKNKNLEADLLMFVLEHVFTLPPGILGTCFTTYDYKTAVMVKRVITIVDTRLHPDYKVEYAEKVNRYLNILHHTSNHIDFIFALPRSI